MFFVVAEGVRFELTRPFGLPVFKTGAINRSATPPNKSDRENCAIPLNLSKARQSILDFGVSSARVGCGFLDSRSARTPLHLIRFLTARLKACEPPHNDRR